jgi:hypothetical protein
MITDDEYPEGWKSLRDAIDEIGNLLENVEWGRPLDRKQARSLRDVAVFIRDDLDDSDDSGPEEMALVSACDALLDWLVATQDQDRIDRVHKSLRVYWTMCTELDQNVDDTLAERIGNINPRTFKCRSCASTRHVEQTDADNWKVTLTHEPGCLWASRPRTDPSAN